MQAHPHALPTKQKHRLTRSTLPVASCTTSLYSLVDDGKQSS